MEHFTLHVRLTKQCNADCSYCSSFAGPGTQAMTLDAYQRAVDFLVGHLAPAGGRAGNFLTIQYVGGEILTLPSETLKACVMYARRRFQECFDEVVDGAQSNLIGSPRKLLVLRTLFGDRLGTSVDHFTQQRTLAGSASKYRVFALKGAQQVGRLRPVPGILVVDRASVAHVEQEVALAKAAGRDLTLRAVFQGGKPEIDALGPAEIRDLYVRLMDDWLMQEPGMRIEPFYHLLGGQLAQVMGLDALRQGITGCPFQRDCAGVSLNLEPNGDLYLCLDMADSGQHCIGNALTGEFDLTLWRALADRRFRIDPKCASCDYFQVCQGGCMSEAIAHTGSMYGRSELCEVWEGLFHRIDAAISHHGAESVYRWYTNLAAKSQSTGQRVAS